MRRSLLLGCKKRGNVILDSTLVMVILFAFALITLAGMYVFTQINDDIQASDDMDATSKATSQDVYNKYPTWFDNGFVTILAISWIFVLVSSFMVDSHPIFFVVSMVGLIVIIIAGAYLTNIYEELIADDEFSAFEDDFSKTLFVIRRLPLVIAVIGVSIAIALYGKSQI